MKIFGGLRRNLKPRGAKPPWVRGQASAEFVITAAALLFILLVGLVLWGFFDMQRIEVGERFAAGRTAFRVASAVNSIHQAGEGSSLVFYNRGLPESNVSIIGNVVYVNYSRTHATEQLVTNQTSYTSIPVNADVRVRNSNGVIYVEPA